MILLPAQNFGAGELRKLKAARGWLPTDKAGRKYSGFGRHLLPLIYRNQPRKLLEGRCPDKSLHKSSHSAVGSKFSALCQFAIRQLRHRLILVFCKTKVNTTTTAHS